MKKKTKTELEAEVKALEPYREAYFCLTAGRIPIVVRSDETWATVVGLDRASGGVVIGINGQDCAVRYVQDAMIEWSQGTDPYFQSIAGQLVHLQKRMIEEREEHLKRRRDALNSLS
jgi:hypothetical protein